MIMESSAARFDALFRTKTAYNNGPIVPEETPAIPIHIRSAMNSGGFRTMRKAMIPTPMTVQRLIFNATLFVFSSSACTKPRFTKNFL